MKKPISMMDKLQARLTKLGLNRRKATEVAKGLAPTAQRAKVSGTVTGKLEAKLLKLGLSERKAKELAKGLAPTVRASIKAKVKKTAIKLADVTDDMVEQAVADATDDTDDAELDKVAPRVNGHRVRLDLPVVDRLEWQTSPLKGVELLRVIDGYSTRGTYLVAAVKGEHGMVAVRQLASDYYNVKFYPTMDHWGYSQEQCETLNAVDYLSRQWYQRMHFSGEGTTKLLAQIHKAQMPLRTRLLQRLLAVTGPSLFKAFGFLHARRGTQQVA